MRRSLTTVFLTLFAFGCELPKKVDHPDNLKFDELQFDLPDAAKHRHVLPSGVVVYVVEDHALPLVEVDLLIRGGSYLDPKGLSGLAQATGGQMRAGGTKSLAPDAFDEEADFLAAQIYSSFGRTEGSAGVDCLAKDLDRGLELLFDMLRHPRFDTDRLNVYKDRVLQSIKRRNDSTAQIESREWARLLRGADHFSSAQVTKASTEALVPDLLANFHRSVVHPGNFVFAVSGDVKTEEILAKLETHLADWTKGQSVPAIPKPTHSPQPGVYIVDKPEVNQGRVIAGHLAPSRDSPDYHALMVMNNILGGGGFTSRIMSRVRSDEGLAYTARSSLSLGTHYAGSFTALFQSKNPSVAQALQICIDEIERIRTEKVSDQELEGAINYYVGVFPRSFSSSSQVANTFASDEITPRTAQFWESFRDKIRAVTADDVLRVAKTHLTPDKLTVLIVGKKDDLLSGNPDAPTFSLEKIAGDGGISDIPLPDPETLVYP